MIGVCFAVAEQKKMVQEHIIDLPYSWVLQAEELDPVLPSPSSVRSIMEREGSQLWTILFPVLGCRKLPFCITTSYKLAINVNVILNIAYKKCTVTVLLSRKWAKT
jgi:hypothetical protein